MSYTNLPWKALGLLFVPLALSAQPVQAQDSGSAKEPLTVRITEGNPYNINYAQWTGADALGNVYGFENVDINGSWIQLTDPESGEIIGDSLVYSIYSEVGFRGAVTNQESIAIPDSIEIDYEGQLLKAPVVRFCLDYYNDDQTGFPNSPNLKDVYVNPSIYYAEWHGEGFANLRNFYFSSAAVPEFSIHDGAQGKLNIYVNDDLFALYTDALANQDVTVWSTTPASPVYVNVATPGTLAEEISNQVENLKNVRWLVVTGTPNEDDLLILRRLPRLQTIDLSATTGIESMTGCNGLKYLTEAILPAGVKEIGDNAFANCSNLRKINIPDGVTRIGDNAFKSTGLTSLTLPASVSVIDSEAFRYSSLASINLENVEKIGDRSFERTKLISVNLTNVKDLESYAFESCYNLTNVIFGKFLHSIGYSEFRECDLRSIKIPESINQIYNNAFDYNYNLKYVEISKNVTYIGNAFYAVKPDTVVSHVLFPLDNSGFNDCDLSETILYVPALTLNEYMRSNAYVDFPTIEPLEEDLTELSLDREYLLKSDKGIADKANIEIGYNHLINDMWHSATGNLTVARKADLNLGKFSMYGQATEEHYTGNGYEWYYNGSTFIPESNVTAEELEINLDLRVETWHFLSFPFDVNVKDIVVDDDALWVVRKYSGEDRAKLNENTWQNMTDETVLKAGEGYIFHCARENSDRVHFTFRPAASNEGFFAKDAVSTPLANYPSEFAHNASWNLVGNPYPAYLNLKGLDFTAPVTLWQNGTYYAYSPVDDELALDPFKAFFVQRQDIEGGDAISFNPAARAHSREAALALDFTPANAPARAARLGNSPRALFNIFVKGENGTDRTRLVINEEASAAYEASCDAAKFMSSEINVPQIFVMNGNSRMAIDERPLAEGVFTLGSRFGAKGEYAISLETRNADGFRAILTDNKTGVTTDITASAYAFTADEGTDNNRFTLALTNTLSGINDAAVSAGISVNMNGNILSVTAPEAVEITVAAADGKVVASANSADFSAELAQGIYVVKAGNTVTKVIAQ